MYFNIYDLCGYFLFECKSYSVNEQNLKEDFVYIAEAVLFCMYLQLFSFH